MLDKLRRAVRVIAKSFLWLVVLVPILGVSAYSLYFIGISLGAPWFIAIAFSTCFDGVTLLSASYSVKYAQAGLSGSFPRTVVRIFAIIAAFLQTLHARIGHEPPGAWILWACLPIGAVLVYEIHIRWERRRALAKAGSVYPAPLPQFGLITWILFPFSTLNQLRDITMARRAALVTAANVVIGDFARETGRTRNTREREEEIILTATGTDDGGVVQPEVLERHREVRRRAPRSAKGTIHAPVRHIRVWAKAQPEFAGKIGDHARLPGYVKQAYYEAHPYQDGQE